MTSIPDQQIGFSMLRGLVAPETIPAAFVWFVSNCFFNSDEYLSYIKLLSSSNEMFTCLIHVHVLENVRPKYLWLVVSTTVVLFMKDRI